MSHDQPAIVGAAELTPGRRVPYTSTELHVLAAVAALADAGVSPDEVDGLVCAEPMTNEGSIFPPEDLMDYLGLHNLKLQMTCQLGGGTHLAMSRMASNVIDRGEAETVLIVSAGKFPPIRDGGRELMSLVCDHAFEMPYGPSVPTLYGLIAQAWMHETGQGKAELAEVTVSQDRWAALNPTAIAHDAQRLSVDDVMPSRPIAGPLHFYHCSIPCEGGPSVGLVSTQRAVRGRARPVRRGAAVVGNSRGCGTRRRRHRRASAGGVRARERRPRTGAIQVGGVVSTYGVSVLGAELAPLVETAEAADRAGFDAAWASEFYSRSGSISMAAMAARTRQCRLGSSILYGVGRSPPVLATEARDLDELSGGRIVLGLGNGTRRMMSDWHGVGDTSSPAVRMEELVPLVRRIWNLHEGPVNDDPQIARREAAQQIAFYSSVKSYEHVLDVSGFARQGAAIHEAFARRDLPAMFAAVTDGMIDAMAVAGTAADVRDGLRRYEGVLDHIVLYTHHR